MGRQERRSDDELREASWHLYYEFVMVDTLVAEFTPTQANTMRQWALLEAFLLHARNLRHVYFPSGRIFGSDILAAHYFAEGEWDRVRGELPPALTVVDSVNPEVMHLSYDRIEMPRPSDWDTDAIHRALRDVTIDRFKANANPALLSPEWHGQPIDVRRPVPHPVLPKLAREGNVVPDLGIGRPAYSTASTMVNTPAPHSKLFRDRS